ncbi:MAG: hypothetical protein IK029_04250 [Oscillospiraceae bacterium]|nr:hypothetical protein [Oscillospiraceae bacterium]
MTINSGAELSAGLSDVPVFIGSLVMFFTALRFRKESRVGKAWSDTCTAVPLTVLMGIIMHVFRIREGYLRFLWPVVYFLITLITGYFWILILEIFRPQGVEKPVRRAILLAVAAVSIVNAVQRFTFGYDLTPLYSMFGIPAVMHCAWTVFRYRDSVSREVRNRSALGVSLLLLSVIVEAAMRKPVTIAGMELGGAFFAHVLIIAAMLVLTGVIRLTSAGEASDE